MTNQHQPLFQNSEKEKGNDVKEDDNNLRSSPSSSSNRQVLTYFNNIIRRNKEIKPLNFNNFDSSANQLIQIAITYVYLEMI
jgi:hypothetical protein